MGSAPLAFSPAHADTRTHTHTGTNTTVAARTWGCKCYHHLPRGSAHLLLSYLLCYGCSGLTVEVDRGMAVLFRSQLFVYRWVSHLHVLGGICLRCNRGGNRRGRVKSYQRSMLRERCQASLVSAGNRVATLKCCLCMWITEARQRWQGNRLSIWMSLKWITAT